MKFQKGQRVLMLTPDQYDGRIGIVLNHIEEFTVQVFLGKKSTLARLKKKQNPVMHPSVVFAYPAELVPIPPRATKAQIEALRAMVYPSGPHEEV